MIIASWWPDLRSWPWSSNIAAQAEKPTNGRPPPIRTPRPNYNKIHVDPLPIVAYPLPLLVPHNPLSLLHIIMVYIKQLIVPPRSHPEHRYQALWSATTGTVHVTEKGTMRALWEKGFFGKGSLSRSEPTWLEREKKKLGVTALDTSEQYTRQRREERRQFKNERAKKEREAIEEKLRQESGGTSSGTAHLANEEQEEDEEASGELHATSSTGVCSEPLAEPVTEAALDAGASYGAEESAHTCGRISQTSPDFVVDSSNLPPPTIPEREFLQLTAEETLFLVYALGVIDVCTPSNPDPISIPDLLALFCARSIFPPIRDLPISPSNPFLISYVAYHHFRSLGWVVRPGIKFGVDYLLYQRGPAFAHAQFSVIVVPSYQHNYWEGRQEVENVRRKSWWWLHAVNRVQSQVLKNLVVAFVEVPAPEKGQEEAKLTDMTGLLKRYKVREMVIKRWTPNRTRD